MRDTIMRAMIAIAFQLTAIAAFSQNNNLAAGDIVFVSYQSDTDLSASQGSTNFNDRFSIVILREGGIPGNTTLYITDVGWNTSVNNFIDDSNEGYISWQVPVTGIRQGTEIYFISTVIGSLYSWSAHTIEAGNSTIGTTISNLNS